MILYEYPFNESIRTMLRLEHLFDRLGQLIPRTEAVDHHFALATLFEIMDVASRADLKSDLIKELDRYKAQLNGYRGNPAISEAVLDQVIGRIDHAHDGLVAMPGKAGQSLQANEWLMSVRSRISIPGGTCEFDLPAYYAWQKSPAEQRQAELQAWTATLMPLAAPGGQYQQSLPNGRTYQLLRLRIDETLGLVPEISGHRLMISIRLMRTDAEGRLKPAGEDASFELTLCA